MLYYVNWCIDALFVSKLWIMLYRFYVNDFRTMIVKMFKIINSYFIFHMCNLENFREQFFFISFLCSRKTFNVTNICDKICHKIVSKLFQICDFIFNVTNISKQNLSQIRFKFAIWYSMWRAFQNRICHKFVLNQHA